MKKKVLICVGTRPNLIKITQFEKAFKKFSNLEYYLLHTGQHYDENMNNVFFKELNLKLPDFQFKLNSSSQIESVSQIMQKFEDVCLELKPDLVVVPGDVNSSFACAFVANRLNIRVAHIESGLRSFDNTMPEEVNRILIDKLSSIHFVTEVSGMNNLTNELVPLKNVHFVGNTMIDTLVAFKNEINHSKILENLEVNDKEYVLFTFHRPVNVDVKEALHKLTKLIKSVSSKKHIVFPIHPRTLNNLKKFNLLDDLNEIENLTICPPLGYFDFLNLIQNSMLVVTDSGGIQEETTFMKVPCLTIRPNTERPITIDIGTNKLLDFNIESIEIEIESILEKKFNDSTIPDFWDGNASERILNAIDSYINK